jgi:hypothetical protein
MSVADDADGGGGVFRVAMNAIVCRGPESKIAWNRQAL